MTLTKKILAWIVTAIGITGFSIMLWQQYSIVQKEEWIPLFLAFLVIFAMLIVWGFLVQFSKNIGLFIKIYSGLVLLASIFGTIKLLQLYLFLKDGNGEVVITITAIIFSIALILSVLITSLSGILVLFCKTKKQKRRILTKKMVLIGAAIIAFLAVVFLIINSIDDVAWPTEKESGKNTENTIKKQLSITQALNEIGINDKKESDIWAEKIKSTICDENYRKDPSCQIITDSKGSFGLLCVYVAWSQSENYYCFLFEHIGKKWTYLEGVGGFEAVPGICIEYTNRNFAIISTEHLGSREGGGFSMDFAKTYYVISKGKIIDKIESMRTGFWRWGLGMPPPEGYKVFVGYSTINSRAIYEVARKRIVIECTLTYGPDKENQYLTAKRANVYNWKGRFLGFVHSRALSTIMEKTPDYTDFPIDQLSRDQDNVYRLFMPELKELLKSKDEKSSSWARDYLASVTNPTGRNATGEK